MRTSLVRLLVPVAVVASLAACGRGASESARLSDDLKKDLEAASSERPELATAAGSFRPMQVVSELEQSNGSAPVERTRTPKRVAARSASLNQPQDKESPAPEVAQEIQVAETPAESPAPAPEADVPRVPSVAPRPSALPVDVPAVGVADVGRGGIGTGRGTGRGGDGIGDIIGIVIRGGGVGVDHCPPRRRGRPRFPINPMR